MLYNDSSSAITLKSCHPEILSQKAILIDRWLDLIQIDIEVYSKDNIIVDCIDPIDINIIKITHIKSVHRKQEYLNSIKRLLISNNDWMNDLNDVTTLQ